MNDKIKEISFGEKIILEPGTELDSKKLFCNNREWENELKKGNNGIGWKEKIIVRGFEAREPISSREIVKELSRGNGSWRLIQILALFCKNPNIFLSFGLYNLFVINDERIILVRGINGDFQMNGVEGADNVWKPYCGCPRIFVPFSS